MPRSDVATPRAPSLAPEGDATETHPEVPLEIIHGLIHHTDIDVGQTANYANGSAQTPHDPPNEVCTCIRTRTALSTLDVSSQTSPSPNEDLTRRTTSCTGALPKNGIKFGESASVRHVCDETENFVSPSKFLKELADIKHIIMSNLSVIGKIKDTP